MSVISLVSCRATHAIGFLLSHGSLAVAAEVAPSLDGLFHFDLLDLALAVAETFAVAVDVVSLGSLASADKYLGVFLGCRAAT